MCVKHHMCDELQVYHALRGGVSGLGADEGREGVVHGRGLRLARRDNAQRLLEILERLGPDKELAASIERVYRQRKRVQPRKVEL